MKKIADLRKRYGFSGIMLNMFCKCLKYIGLKISFWSFYVKDINKLQETTLIRFKELHLSDFENQHMVNSEWFTVKKIKDLKQAFLIEGNHCYGYYDGDVLACYGWISLKQLGLENTILMEDDCLFWDDYTHPDFRGKGLHKDLNLFRIARMVEYGKKRALTFIANYNRASRVGYERSGFNLSSQFIEYRLGKGKQKTTLKYGI